MTPSWYDVLDVEPDATPEEIRAAWKTSIADLDPSDRRFKLRSSAAEVLLDPDRRAAHDAELAAEAAAAAEAGTEDAAYADGATAEPVATTTGGTPVEPVARTRPARSRRGLLWLVPAVLAVVAVLLVATTAVALTRGSDGRPLPDEDEVAAARSAAEAAVVPILSYDYRTLPDDKAAAEGFMTDSYREQYDQYFAAVVEENAPATETVVNVQPISSGIVRTGPGQVDVLAFINRPTQNAQATRVFRDQVVLRMVDQGDRWLVDCLITTAGGTCGD